MPGKPIDQRMRRMPRTAEPNRPRAGAAFMLVVRRDPAGRRALRRVHRRMQAIAREFASPAFRLELKQSRRAKQSAVTRLADQIRQALRATGDELAARGLPTPTTLDDWEHLARIIEMPFNTIRSGDYTLRDVYVMALAWVDRQTIVRGRARKTGPKADGRQVESALKFTVAALRELTGLGNTTLNKYARLAGVRTPRRGQRNFRYSAADVRKILAAIIANSGEAAVRSRCRAALREIAK